ncbi:glycosyl hydrolase family 95 catalytic domain-containing protein [Carboxylicivirga sp. N1Y90]|uniref:glycosyl hydrolase family 95 catalytic domain-containing protein n=1 Tax=Carboxylicivirga fragile TaxID=3417571 RepID=UPI003D349E7D|nr:glycoside hydrolase family 95 protein [Marinilabiliaceae bacterium N1Y90]
MHLKKKQLLGLFLTLVYLALFQLQSLEAQGQIQFIPRKGFVSWLPAAKWEDALLTGNGEMGAMVMGNPFEETIILNHALLFLPNEKPVIPPDMTDYQDTIKQLSFEGKYQEVAELGYDLWQEQYGPKRWTDSFVPAANITIDMPASNVDKYRRMVNYETAEAIVEWTDQQGAFTRKTFVSRADGIVVTFIEGTSPIDAEISLHKQPHSWEQNATMDQLITHSTTSIEDEFIHYHCQYGKAHNYSPDGYDGLLKVINDGGELTKSGNRYKVQGVTSVLIITAIEPYKGSNHEVVSNLKNKLNSIDANYTSLLDKQKASHGKLYNRVSLSLAVSEEEREMNSETLVSKVRQNTSVGIMQRQFEAARYNILCSTGTNPPNLQGIWSGTWTPPWSSDFTHDGNVQVAISNLLNGNMPELMMAYFKYHERMMDNYRINAQQLYGVHGIHIPSHTSSHGLNNHYDETWCMEYWNGGAGWAASYFYDYYLYTQDIEFLKKRAFPFMTEALLFWEDFLTMGDDGKYIVVPSYSPENNPLEHRWQNCINATMDVMIIKELTRNWISAAKKLGVSQKEIRQKEEFLSSLPDYQISEDGVLREWLWEGLTDNQAHRHASHLYGVYEVPDEEILTSEKLQEAVKTTIKERMKIRKQQQGGEMAFGMCHLGFAAVNMYDKETATEILEYLSRFYWTNSMATTHNPGHLFNMDISGGIPSLMTRMIINSSPGYISLFSALPDDWTEGQLNGVLVRGGIACDEIKWNKTNAEVKLVSALNQKVEIDFGNKYNINGIDVIGARYNINNSKLIIHFKRGKSVEVMVNKK